MCGMTEATIVSIDDHRRLAATTYNVCWDLLESERTALQDRDLVGLALTSRFHWQRAGGGSEESAIADWMVSRCFAAVGDAAQSMSFAQAALDDLPSDAPEWLKASIHEGLALAYAVAGERVSRDRHVALAHEHLALEPDPESRNLIAGQLATLP